MKLEFILKNKSKSFNETQRRFLESFIDDPQNWKNFKQDFISLELVSVSSNSIVVNVEDTGNRWYKHFSRKLCSRGKLGELCTLPTGKTGRVLFETVIKI